MIKVYSLTFSIAIFLAFSWAAWVAMDFNEMARYFPLTIAAGGIIFTLVNIVIESRELNLKKKQISSGEDKASEAEDRAFLQNMKKDGKNFLWILFYLISVIVFGYIIGTALFLVSFLKVKTDFKVITIIISTAIVVTVIIYMGGALGLHWPSGIIGII